MMKLSKGAQDIANQTVIREPQISQGQKDAMYLLVMQKKAALPSNEPLLEMGPPRWRMKRALLIAAVLAALALAGAGYGASIYFDRLFTRGEDSSGLRESEYDILEQHPEIAGIPPAFSNDDSSDEGAIPVIEMESIGRLDMLPLFEGKQAGELFDAEIHHNGRKNMAHGLAGTGLNMISITNEYGLTNRYVIPNGEYAASTRGIIEQKIRQGEFMVTLEHTEFTPVDYVDYGLSQELTYSDGEGIRVQVSIDYSGLYLDMAMPGSVYDNANPQDITLGGNPFVLFQIGDSYTAALYLGEQDERVSCGVDFRFGGVAKDRERVLDILDTVTVHNREANQLVMADEAFFAGFPQADIADHGAEIIAAIQTGPLDDGEYFDAKVWERGRFSVMTVEPGWWFVLESEEVFGAEDTLYPYDGQHTVLTGQSWFPKDAFNSLILDYEGTKLQSATYHSNSRYTLKSTIADNPYLLTPLDAILSTMDNSVQHMEVDGVFLSDPAYPIVVMSEADGEKGAVFSAIEMETGEYLVQVLNMPKSELPEQLQ